MQENDIDLQRICDEYQKDNEKLHLRVKELEKQISTGTNEIKIQNRNLRQRISELEGSQKSLEDYQRLQEEYVSYVNKAKQNEKELLEQIDFLQNENEILKNRNHNALLWDNNERRNASINSVLRSLCFAYKQGKGVEEAFNNFAAIIAPEILVKHDVQSKPTNISQNNEIEELKKELKELKSKVNTHRKSNIPTSRLGIPSTQPKIRELEQQISQQQTKITEIQKENTNLRNRSKERSTKIKELKEQLVKSQDTISEERRKHQIEIANITIERDELSLKVKSLQETNTENENIKSEYEKIKAKAEKLEKENKELKKPKKTGIDAFDDVLNAISMMEVDIQQRKLALNRMAMELQDKFEEEKRLMENQHKIEIEDKNQKLKRLKKEFEAILSDLERSKKNKRK